MYQPKQKTVVKHHPLYKNFDTNSFTLLSWNIAKLSTAKVFQEKLTEILQREEVDFLALQEVKMGQSWDDFLAEFSYVFAPNMQTGRNLYGVMNAFKLPCYEHKTFLSATRELFYLTHKSYLFTSHLLPNNNKLLVLNIHSINFVPAKQFQRELVFIAKQLRDYEGAMVVAGDFNTWSVQRMRYLQEFVDDLQLQSLAVEQKGLKKFFGKPLDHILFRGLKVEDAKVAETQKVSDHNPIVVKFLI